MPCFVPLEGWRSRVRTASGKRSIVFNPKDGLLDMPISVACGQCIGCKLERSRVWAVRATHEASLYDDNCFITLTYSDDNVPLGNTLVRKDFQDFMKRLRRRVGRENIRLIYCGEYGDKYGRPHYHACLFNYDFPDKIPYSQNANGDVVYMSPLLDDLWQAGISQIGTVTFQSAAYVARYCVKKITGDMAKSHYEWVSPDGEVFNRVPEFFQPSLKPGIGKGWYDRFGETDIFAWDEMIVNGKKMKVPRYYEGLYELNNRPRLAKIRRKRIDNARPSDKSFNAYSAKSEIADARMKQLKRKVD